MHDRTNCFLLGLCGTGNMILGCMMVWFSKPPDAGMHIVGGLGMLFAVTGLLQKVGAAGAWLDMEAKERRARASKKQ